MERSSQEVAAFVRGLKLASKVRYEPDPTIGYPRHFSGHVRIKLRSGTILEEDQPFPRGGLESPLSPEEIEDKFRANAGMALTREKGEKVVARVRTLEELRSIKELTDLLAPE